MKEHSIQYKFGDIWLCNRCSHTQLVNKTVRSFRCLFTWRLSWKSIQKQPIVLTCVCYSMFVVCTSFLTAWISTWCMALQTSPPASPNWLCGSKADVSLFIKRDSSRVLFLQIYFDDIIFTRSSSMEIELLCFILILCLKESRSFAFLSWDRSFSEYWWLALINKYTYMIFWFVPTYRRLNRCSLQCNLLRA